MIFLFCDLPACNKKAEILPLTITLIAHLRSQFNHVFTLLIPMQAVGGVSPKPLLASGD